MGTTRSARIEVRVTVPEHDAITARARKAGLTVSAYMRSVALGQSAPKLPSSLDADELRRAHANLKHAGSNLNQWVRAVNSYGIRGPMSAQRRARPTKSQPRPPQLRMNFPPCVEGGMDDEGSGWGARVRGNHLCPLLASRGGAVRLSD